MSVLASLLRAYDRLPDAPPYGFSSEKIGFLISLDEDGTVAHVVDLRAREGKRRDPRVVSVPASFKRPGTTPRSFFLWDNSAFVLGVSADERKGEARHLAFRQLHLKNLADTKDEGLLALHRFVEDWQPDNFRRLGWPEDMKDRNIVFALEAERRERFLHERPAAKAMWLRLSSEKQRSGAVCLVTGEQATIAKLHPAIKAVPARKAARTRIALSPSTSTPSPPTVTSRATTPPSLRPRPLPTRQPSTVSWPREREPHPDRRRLDRVLG